MEKMLVLHGGPGLDSSYFQDKFERNLPEIKIIKPNYNKKCFSSLNSQIEDIATITPSVSYIYAHSFGSLLLLYFLSKYSIKKEVKIIFSNWIYDYEWVDIFNKNYPDKSEAIPDLSLKEQLLYYSDLYFNTKDIEDRREMLKKIKCSDNISKLVYDQIQSFNSINTLESYSRQIVSIHSRYEKIIDPSYVSKICDKFNIQNYLVNSYSHFPFLDNESEFFKSLKEIL